MVTALDVTKRYGTPSAPFAPPLGQAVAAPGDGGGSGAGAPPPQGPSGPSSCHGTVLDEDHSQELENTIAAARAAAAELASQSQDTPPPGQAADHPTPSASSTAPVPSTSQATTTSKFVPFRVEKLLQFLPGALSSQAASLYQGLLSGGRRIFRLQGPGNDEDWTRQVSSKASQGSLLYQSGHPLPEIEERYRDQEYCKHFLAEAQENWFQFVTPDSACDKAAFKSMRVPTSRKAGFRNAT